DAKAFSDMLDKQHQRDREYQQDMERIQDRQDQNLRDMRAQNQTPYHSYAPTYQPPSAIDQWYQQYQNGTIPDSPNWQGNQMQRNMQLQQSPLLLQPRNLGVPG